MAITKEWLEETIEISRGEFGDILASEIAEMMKIAELSKMNTGTQELVKELLTEFSAAVATRVFMPLEKEEE